MSTDSTSSTSAPEYAAPDTTRARAFDAPDPEAIASVIMREPWPSRAHVLEHRLVTHLVASAMEYARDHIDGPSGMDYVQEHPASDPWTVAFPSGEWAETADRCTGGPKQPWVSGDLDARARWLTGLARRAWESSGVDAGNLALYNRHHDGPEAARLAAGELEAACYVAAAAFRIIEVIRDDTQGKAARGYAVIEAYPYSDDPVTLATDAIADLLHMVAAEDADYGPEDVIRTALRNYHAERNGEDVI